MSLSSGARLGSYEIVAAIGAGGMGKVFRAQDTKLSRDVAMKVLPGDRRTKPAIWRGRCVRLIPLAPLEDEMRIIGDGSTDAGSRT